MSPELEMGTGMGAGTGMAFPIDPFPPSSAVPGAAYLYGLPQSASADAMRVDDLLDFSVQPGFFDSAPSAPNPHLQPYYPHPEPPAASDIAAFPFDLCIPGEEEAAELEWLSRFVEDSFSGGMAFPGMGGAGAIAAAGGGGGVHYGLEEQNYQAAEAGAVPGRPRTKRSRPPGASAAVAAAWSALAPASPSSSSSSSDTRPRGARKDQKEAEAGGVRKCTHCASEKTPQWRTGPLGPKTLCNACGVRYKSGRLVPEYRPAASPTFVLTQHSNSHRKVMELRRQKEMLIRHQQAAAFAASPGGSAMPTAASARPDLLLRDYEVC